MTFCEEGAVRAWRASSGWSNDPNSLVDISYAMSMHSSWWMKKGKGVRARKMLAGIQWRFSYSGMRNCVERCSAGVAEVVIYEPFLARHAVSTWRMGCLRCTSWGNRQFSPWITCRIVFSGRSGWGESGLRS